jgi:RNA polymerase sigma-70 factor (ECF subfamily)
MRGDRVEVEDERLLRALSASHPRPLLTYTQRVLGGDLQSAKDIVQETLLRAWQHAENLDAEHARPWLYTVAWHLVIDQGRHRPNQGRDTASAPMPEVSISDSWTRRRIPACSRTRSAPSPPAHREVLVEGFHAGRTTREIAERFNMSNDTVRSRMSYALRALRLALPERGVQQP